MAKKVSFEDVRVVRGSSKALLCEINGEQHWIPKSQIDDDSEVFDDGENAEGTLVLPEWLAVEKGLV